MVHQIKVIFSTLGSLLGLEMISYSQKKKKRKLKSFDSRFHLNQSSWIQLHVAKYFAIFIKFSPPLFQGLLFCAQTSLRKRSTQN